MPFNQGQKAPKRFDKKTRKEIRRTIKIAYARGLKTREVAAYLNEQGLKTANGKAFTNQDVRNQALTIPGCRIGKEKRRHSNGNGIALEPKPKPKPKSAAGFKLPVSLELMLDDEELSDSQKIQILRTFKGHAALATA